MKEKRGLLDIQLRRVFLLQFFMAAVSFLNSVADGIITGRFLGPEAISAIALYSPIMTFSGLIYIFINGSNIMACAHIGRGEVDKVRSVFSTGLILVFAFSALLASVVFVFSEPLSRMLGAYGLLEDYLSAYLRGMALGIPGNMISGMLMAFLAINNHSKLSYWSVAASFVINLVLNIVCVTAFNGNMLGIGLATSASYYVSTAILSMGFRKEEEGAPLYFSSRGLCFQRAGEMVKYGNVKLYMTVSKLIARYIINYSFIQNLGVNGTAVLTVYSTMTTLMSAVTSSLVSGEQTIGSIIYSQREKTKYKALYYASLKLGMSLMIPLALVMILFRGPISSLFFAPGSGAWEVSCRMMVCCAVLFPLNCFFFVLLYMYRIREKLKLVNFILFENQLGSALMAATLLGVIKTDWVWLAFALNEVLSMALLWIYAWYKNGRVSLDTDSILLMKEFDTAGYTSLLSITVSTMEEAVHIAERVYAIAKEQGIPNRICMNTALCLEEITANIITHGFTDKGDQEISIHINMHDGNIFSYLWDNGSLFDTKDYISQFAVLQDDVGKNIGLRIVAKLADEIVYQNRFDMNFLVIRIALAEGSGVQKHAALNAVNMPE